MMAMPSLLDSGDGTGFSTVGIVCKKLVYASLADGTSTLIKKVRVFYATCGIPPETWGVSLLGQITIVAAPFYRLRSSPMCGIAGIVDLGGRRAVPEGIVERMAAALVHRGPDEAGFLYRPGLALASRRLSVVGLADGQQPVTNEDKNVFVVFNGELFDHVERRAASRGHRLVTHCDTEIIPHLWEESHEAMFEGLRGQFAVALYDAQRHQLTLARDRFGISPLYWTRQGDWLLFASEIKGLLASGMVKAKPDLRGIDQTDL